MESILEGTRAGTWEWNIETGELSQINERWAEIPGSIKKKSLNPISIKTWGALVHPDDLKKSNEELKRLLTAKQTTMRLSAV